jgi:exosortase A-associated hydrolase 1
VNAAAETALALGDGDARRVAILHRPAELACDTGVVIVVGGPQYRVGSHRQFVLLARRLADEGVAVLRFDCTGMGDSGAAATPFDGSGPDIAAATSLLLESVPGLRHVCLWGLCDGASAALIHAASDARIASLVLLNPWVRTEAGLAQAYLDNYYGRRMRNAAYWRKLLADPARLLRAVSGYLRNRVAARSEASPDTDGAQPFLVRMLAGAQAFRGRTLVLLSGQDTVAAEFEGLLQRDPAWGRAFARASCSQHKLAEANHTFARREWRDWVAERTVGFVLGGGEP